MKYVLVLLVSVLLLTSCQWVEPPPDYLADAFHDGAVYGCITHFLMVAGPPPSEQHLLQLVQTCEQVAEGLTLEMDDLPPLPQAAPVPAAGPGSML